MRPHGNWHGIALYLKLVHPQFFKSLDISDEVPDDTDAFKYYAPPVECKDKNLDNHQGSHVQVKLGESPTQDEVNLRAEIKGIKAS
jgi:hypothetical protein